MIPSLEYPPPCVCGHRWGVHGPNGACLGWNKLGNGRVSCDCTDFQPKEVSPSPQGDPDE